MFTRAVAVSAISAPISLFIVKSLFSFFQTSFDSARTWSWWLENYPCSLWSICSFLYIFLYPKEGWVGLVFLPIRQTDFSAHEIKNVVTLFAAFD